jgi:16S rRNA C1402 N4-methylase RsmH
MFRYSIFTHKQVNEGSELDLISILERYGQLRGAKAIAKAIIAKRPLKTTRELK